MAETPPPEGKAIGWLNAVKGLTFTNVLMIALLVVIAIPAYTVYRALSDDKLLDRLMSTYEDLGSYGGCTLRHVQERGGPDLWSVASGFAFQGNDRWQISVVLQEQPEGETLTAFCDSLKLITASMLERGGGSEIYPDQCRVLQQTGVDTTGLCPPPPPPKKRPVNEARR